MNWINVKSTSIAKFAWNKDTSELYVVHVSSSQPYTYVNFDSNDYSSLMKVVTSGSSIGKYYHHNIKNNPKHNLNL